MKNMISPEELEKELESRIDDLKGVTRRLFDYEYDVNSITFGRDVKVGFLPSEEMRKYSHSNFDEMKETIDLILDEPEWGSYNDEVWGIVSELEDAKNGNGYITAQSVERNLEEILNAPDLTYEEKEKIKSIIELVRNIQFKIDLLGVYIHEKRQIYICPENIIEERPDENDYLALAESVFVHEYTHFLHFANLNQRYKKIENGYDKVKREAVFETVAECIQWKFIERYCWHIHKWIEDHSRLGCFPAWGYAGADLIRNSSYNEDVFFKTLYETSLVDWRRAYSYLDTLNEMKGFIKRS